MKLTVEFVAKSLNLATLTRKLDFTFVTSDSRKVAPGCLFVALRGEKFDGHDFIENAAQKGAAGIVCEKGRGAKGALNFEVSDTLIAYRELAGAWRKLFSIPLVAVAGSVGKTTTKEILTAVLRGKFKNVLKTQGSQNGFVGIAMTLLELNSDTQAAVIEVGIDEPGAMIQHLELVCPTCSVLTAIGPEHLEKLRDLPTVACEEGIALTFVAAEGGTVAVNLDDPWIEPFFSKIQSKLKWGFTQGKNNSPNVLQGNLEEDELKVSGYGNFKLPLPGKHNAQNLLAAVTVARTLNLSASEINLGLKTFQGAEGRSQVRELPGSTYVVCDYYNANPTSVEAGLDLLSQVAKRDDRVRPRIACLADMLELGDGEESFHRELYKKIMDLGIERVLLFGERMRALDSELRTRGFGGKIAHFTSRDDLAAELEKIALPGSAILIKGSHSMKMEEVWNKIAGKNS